MCSPEWAPILLFSGLKGHPGDFFVVPDLPENLLNTPVNTAEMVSQIYQNISFFAILLHFLNLVLTVFFKLKVSTGSKKKVMQVEGMEILFPTDYKEFFGWHSLFFRRLACLASLPSIYVMALRRAGTFERFHLPTSQ
ncbi:unnamed protein product [Ixodes pacificus]